MTDHHIIIDRIANARRKTLIHLKGAQAGDSRGCGLWMGYRTAVLRDDERQRQALYDARTNET